MIEFEPGTNPEYVDPYGVLSEHSDIRRIYFSFEHPAKEAALNALCAVRPVNEDVDVVTSDVVMPYTVKAGLYYLGAAVNNLASKDSDERAALNIEVPSSSPAHVQDVVKCAISLQMHHVFNVAYQGLGRLPYELTDYDVYSPCVHILGSGIILARHVAGLTPEELFSAVPVVAGNIPMVRETYAYFVAASKQVDTYTVSGKNAGYGYTTAEAGYGIMRASRPQFAKFILEVSDVFWRGRSTDEYDETVEAHFTQDDAVHIAASVDGLARVMSRRKNFDTFNSSVFMRILCTIKPRADGILLHDMYAPSFDKLADVFHLADVELPDEYLKQLLAAGHNDIAWEYYSAFGVSSIPAMDIFRANINSDCFAFTQAIIDGALAPEHAVIGISKTGSEGVEQLKRIVYSIQEFIALPDKTTQDYERELTRIKASPMYERLWRAAVRFDYAAYGSTHTSEIERLLMDYAEYSREPDSAPYPLDVDMYQPSEFVEVSERQSGIAKLPRGVKNAINSFIRVADLAWQVDDDADAFRGRIATLFDNTYILREKLSAQLAASNDPEKSARLTEQLGLFNFFDNPDAHNLLLDVTTPENFFAAYRLIGNLPIARDILREKALRCAKISLGRELDVAYKSLRQTKSASDRLDVASELIDHLIVQEFLAKVRPSDTAFNKWVKDELFDTSIFRTVVGGIAQEDCGSEGKRVLQFIPNRDIGLELSGQIGDACWASRNQSIAELYPHITAVLIAENTAEQQAFVGSGLFIEAESDEGVPLLIVRGLNPIQNVVNQLNADDFVGKFLAYAQATAQKGGRTLAVVYDDVGRASTNRPAIFRALGNLWATGKLVPVSVAPEQVTFNGYDLENSVFLVGH